MSGFVPPAPKGNSECKPLLAVAIGVVLGIVVGAIGWGFSGEIEWFWAPPIFAMRCSLICAELRPNVLWGKHK